jgi:hypothetical protein
LAPDFKAIADFHKDKGTAFQATCRAFVQFCRQVGLVGGQWGGYRRLQIPGGGVAT